MLLIALFSLDIKIVVLAISLTLSLFYFVGFRLRKYLEKKSGFENSNDSSSIEGAMLGLFALFLAFTFSMASSRFDTRREVIVTEANAIGTAILRADLYPDSIRNAMRTHFKTYVEQRIAYHNAIIDEAKISQSLTLATAESDALWQMATTLAKTKEHDLASRLMIPALNDMIDVVTSRDAAKNARVPDLVLWVLLLFGYCASFMVGYGTKGATINYFVGISFIVMITIAMYLIADLNRPRRGFINTEGANHKVEELRQLFE